MTDNRRRPTPIVGGETGEDLTVISESLPTESELARRRLRERWELASVLNFLNVFEPVIGSKMKISAEEIEAALIKPSSLLAQLHITLLQGIPPVSKNLNGSDVWVTVLCKKLAMWWPWVAEGDIPLTAAKGEEISRYKELDPAIRLLILKALCEIRADQDDTVSYINDALKNGTEISCFRKDKIGENGNGTAYWYDGNTIIGYRLYKEVNKFESKPKGKGKGTAPAISSHWETLATNLEEFRKVVDEFSSSKVKAEVTVGKTIETDAIPVLEKLQKKKERVLKQQQRTEKLLNGFRDSGVTRSCRNRRPVRYTFDEYDRAIEEAIRVTKKRKTAEDRRHEEKHSECGEDDKTACNGGSETETKLRDSAVDKYDSMESDTESDKLQEVDDDDDDDDDDEYDGEKDDNNNNNEDGSSSSNSDKENNDIENGNRVTHHSRKQISSLAHKPVGPRWSKRLAGIDSHPVSDARNLAAKNRLRQRPTRNTALESAVVPDSEDGNSSEDVNNSMSSGENLSPAADPSADSDN
uniref:DDT domain-containing protein DDR4 n=1 Tax=Davidia involucrata TaxID=16924 RepID=A0A5B7BG64_DAVIN